MDTMNNIIVSMGVAVLVVVFGFVFFAPKIEQPVGAVPSLQSPTEINGIMTYYESRSLNQASTTICSIKSPVATSTLDFGSVKLSTGTTTPIALEIGKSTVPDATTTRIAYISDVPASAKITLLAVTASTTGVYGAFSQQHTTDEGDLVFAPNTFMNVKYGKPQGTLNVLVGSCKAKFIIN